MPQLYFRHSYIYQQMLDKATGQIHNQSGYEQGVEFTQKYAEHWQQYNDEIFLYYKDLGFEFADFWVAYFIQPNKQLTPFSDPLTLFINPDLQELTCILIHELCHVLQVYPDNSELTNKLLGHVIKTFPNNTLDVNIEIVTILLARGGINKIFGQEYLDKFSQSEKSLNILKDAWTIIDKQVDVLSETNPVESILKLK